MTVESVEKRERRRVREQRKLAAFKHALKYMRDPIEALKWTYGMYTTWDAVRRLASELLNADVKDVGLAWQILYYVRDTVPDGRERLREATDAAVKGWEAEVAP